MEIKETINLEHASYSKNISIDNMYKLENEIPSPLIELFTILTSIIQYQTPQRHTHTK